MFIALTVVAVVFTKAASFGSYFIRKDERAGRDREQLMSYYRSFLAISIVGKKLFASLATSFLVFTVISMFNMAGDTPVSEVYKYVLIGLNLATVFCLSSITAKMILNKESKIFRKEVDAAMSDQGDGSGDGTKS